MRKESLTVRRQGFHVILAKQFTELAASFASEEIRVVWPARNIISDAKSILGVMALTAEGPEEDRAVEALAALWSEHG
ncbi:HPr family phosphocarrier protein [Paenibacillus mucilaginosus]|uniref:HPr domain-containing protein n=1 Tax=Paenibacillus mucilaginosus (strain KNP414) TaxID=1036673 RepID=F8FL29_PAEMK|nr:HPr family phosphocarrier protein [Paenibacillus mucilaginosus]AEI39948.1 hypothetical protein KNP414_01384 [Paenibacillus mucilaginosus KNP414]MCG7216374.1 HPr family phosphocarrier protein [Paenibacillus mucilaginosus]WDM29208.1 HPr family phosphocarrier protein [Paenibacillus mucilaginosus]